MSFTTTANRNDYTGNGATTTYDYTFKILAATHLKVTIRDSNGVDTLKSYPTDYTVTGVGSAAGGTIVLATALPSGHKIAIVRWLPLTQPTDIRNQGGYFPDTVEDQLDRFGHEILQLQDQLNRSPQVPITEGTFSNALPSVESRAGTLMGWDANGAITSYASVPNIAAGTTAQFYRGDGVFSSTLTGSLTINGAANRKVEIQDSGNSNRGGYILGLSGGFMVSSNSGVFPTYLAQDGTVVLELDVNKRATFYAPASGNTLSILANLGSETYTDYINSLATGLTAYRARNVGGVDFRAGANANTYGLVGTVTNHSLYFQTNSLDRVAIGASGGVTVFAPTSGASLVFNEATTTVIPGTTSFRLRNNANSSTNWQVTDSGRITNPSNTQPAYAVRTSANRTTTGTFDTYGTTTYNQGSHVNASTGLFTAPVDGLHIFAASISALASVGSCVVLVEIVAGGSVIASSLFNVGTANSIIVSLTGMARLGSSQTAYARVSSITGGTISYVRCEYFQGTLLF